MTDMHKNYHHMKRIIEQIVKVQYISLNVCTVPGSSRI